MTQFTVKPLREVVIPIERPEAPQIGKIYRQIGVRLWGQGAYERESIDGGQTQYKFLNRVIHGDIIVNKIWARNGSVSIVRDDTDGCYASTEFPLFVPNRNKLDPFWFFYLTKTPQFWHQCSEKSFSTSGKNRIRPEQFLSIEIPLPPLDEQRRIDALAARIAEACGLRQQAVEEAEALINTAAKREFTRIPSSLSTTVALVCDVKGGIQKSGDRTPTHRPTRYLTVAHVQRNYIDTSDLRYFEVSEDELEKWRLIFGDVLIVEGNGSSEQIGRTALFQGEIQNCVHQNHIIRVRPDQHKLQPSFLNHFFNSLLGKQAMQDISRTSSGLFHLSVGKIQSLVIPLPPLPEQQRIVAELDDLHARVAALKRLQAETQAELDALLPSVLDQAFKGEL